MTPRRSWLVLNPIIKPAAASDQIKIRRLDWRKKGLSILSLVVLVFHFHLRFILSSAELIWLQLKCLHASAFVDKKEVHKPIRTKYLWRNVGLLLLVRWAVSNFWGIFGNNTAELHCMELITTSRKVFPPLPFLLSNWLTFASAFYCAHCSKLKLELEQTVFNANQFKAFPGQFKLSFL